MNADSRHMSFEFSELRHRTATIGQPELPEMSTRVVNDGQVAIPGDEGTIASNDIDVMDGDMQIDEGEIENGGPKLNVSDEGGHEMVKTDEQESTSERTHEAAEKVGEASEEGSDVEMKDTVMEEVGHLGRHKVIRIKFRMSNNEQNGTQRSRELSTVDKETSGEGSNGDFDGMDAVDQEIAEEDTEEVEESGDEAEESDEEAKESSEEVEGSDKEAEESAEENDEESDEYSYENEVVLISQDATQILVPSIMTYVPMPIDPEQRKAALLDVFLFYSKYLYIKWRYQRIDPFDVFPMEMAWTLWEPLFSNEETARIIEKNEKEFLDGVLANMLRVVPLVHTISKYTAIPTSKWNLEVVRRKDAHIQREQFFKLLLEGQQSQTDAWIGTFFSKCKAAMDFAGLTMERLLNRTGERDYWTSQLAHVAALHFLHVVIPSAELRLGNNYALHDLLDVILCISNNNTTSQLPTLVEDDTIKGMRSSLKQLNIGPRV